MSIFEFWSEIGPNQHIHPADKRIFDRLGSGHGFDLHCLPLNFAGPLKTAPIVLLYLSPGLSQEDLDLAKSQRGKRHYSEQRTGTFPLSDLNSAAAAWRKERLSWIGHPDKIRSKVATANIGAYHSHSFVDDHILAALPSSRAMLDWAHNVLFPEAERGERIVVCMRKARFWGLEPGRRYGKALFAPETNRRGHMINGPLRAEIERLASKFLMGVTPRL